MGADQLAKEIGEKGVVLETRGSVRSDQAQLRHRGFIDRMKEKCPTIEVRSLNTEWVADNAYKIVLDAFTQNPNINGVFSHNDEMVRGVVSALRTWTTRAAGEISARKNRFKRPIKAKKERSV